MFGRWWFLIALLLASLLIGSMVVLFAADAFGYGGEINVWLESRFSLTYHSPLSTLANVILALVPIFLMLLYLLRLRRKPILIASTYLWKKSIEDLHVNSLLQWLRRNVLLILQLFVVGCGMVAVLAPKIHGSKSDGSYFILMIDNSASMSATDINPNRLEWAKSEATRQIADMNDSDSAMIIVFNSTAEIRQTYTTNKDLLRKAIEEIHPTIFSTQIEEALSLASSLANPLRSTEDVAVRPVDPEPGKERTYAAIEGLAAEIHLYSDGRFADQPNFALANLQLNFHAPESKDRGHANNLAITKIDAIRDEALPTNLQVSLSLMNFRQTPATVSVEIDLLDSSRKVIDARRADATIDQRNYEETPHPEQKDRVIAQDQPGETLVRFDFSQVEQNRDFSIRAKLVGLKDDLSADNEAWVVLGQIRKAQILLVTSGNLVLSNFFSSKAIRAIADVVVKKPAELTNEKEYRIPTQEGRFDLIIYDRCGPNREEEMPRANTLFIGHPPPPWHFDGVADNYRVEKVEFPSIRGWNDQDPVMRGLRGWYELEIAEAYRFKNLPPKTPRHLESDQELLLMFTLSRQTYRDLVMAFPLSTTDEKWNTRWFLKPVFPLFLWNVVRTLGNVHDLTTEENVSPGLPIRFALSGQDTEVSVLTPSKYTLTLPRTNRNDISFSQTDELGLYQAKWKSHLQQFAVNLFDVNESNIEPRTSIKIGDVGIQSGEQRKKTRELWHWPIMLGILILILEWWIYHRRVHI